MKTPIIGITVDDKDAGDFSPWPHYAVRKHYSNAVLQTGGIAVHLSQIHDKIDPYLDIIDGLIIIGNAYDVDPKHYGEDSRHEATRTKDHRIEFEFALLKGVLERDMPILGICGGQQLMHVHFGGTLIQHIEDEVDTDIDHYQDQIMMVNLHHDVIVKPDTLFHSIVGKEKISVNSRHHQAAREDGDVVISGISTDGVVEVIEHPDYKFCLGVEWHPEYLVTEDDRKIFDAFIAASK